jgi:signal transduction histidine kinase
MTWSPQTHRILGDAAGTRAPSFDTFLELVHPTERARVAATMSEAMDGGACYETEFRIVGYDNVARWVMGRGKALRNGRPPRMLGVFVDVTERHRTQRELRELSERLIQGHERERRRLAREIHDGVAQRLSILSMEARLLDRDLAGTGDAARARCADLANEIAALGNELHRVSYELHPARLEQLGLEAAIRTFCAQIAQTHPVDISLQVGDVPPTLDPEIALCIYRVTQEALNNVVQHSGAAAVKVALGVVAGELRLRVEDDGDGFNPTEAVTTDSLGLTSMRERVRLIGGTLLIDAGPGAGTAIEARVVVTGDGDA